MPKAEISWKRVTPEGLPLQVYAQHVGREWRFFAREKRYDRWQAIAEPPLEDWLALLDAVQRRINRRLLRPEEEARVKQAIIERYPEAQFGRGRMG
ncbi:MAG TPA: hypothetical protein VMU04_14270 [Candidatus Acidoferrum sp.]|nr:hypothetical protein [Candidatus Acidoferrum sp.]